MTDEGLIELAAGFSACLVDCRAAGGFAESSGNWGGGKALIARSPSLALRAFRRASSLQFGVPGSIYRLLLHSFSGPKSLTDTPKASRAALGCPSPAISLWKTDSKRPNMPSMLQRPR